MPTAPAAVRRPNVLPRAAIAALALALAGPGGATPALAAPPDPGLPATNQGLVKLERIFAATGGTTAREIHVWTFEVTLDPFWQGKSVDFARPSHVWIPWGKRGPLTDWAPVFDTVPGAPGYSPYRRVHKLHVSPGWRKPPRDTADVRRLIAAGGRDEPLDMAINAPIVAPGTRLEGSPQRPLRAWSGGRPVHHFVFDTQPLRGGRVQTMPIWVLWRPDQPDHPLREDRAGIRLTNEIVPHVPVPSVSTPRRPIRNAYSSLMTEHRVKVPKRYRLGALRTPAALEAEAARPGSGITIQRDVGTIGNVPVRGSERQTLW